MNLNPHNNILSNSTGDKTVSIVFVSIRFGGGKKMIHSGIAEGLKKRSIFLSDWYTKITV